MAILNDGTNDGVVIIDGTPHGKSIDLSGIDSTEEMAQVLAGRGLEVVSRAFLQSMLTELHELRHQVAES